MNKNKINTFLFLFFKFLLKRESRIIKKGNTLDKRRGEGIKSKGGIKVRKREGIFLH